jgi:GNAT superfamily N-acetyltransferase
MKIEYRHDESLSVESFLGLVRKVWPRVYDEQLTRVALLRTLNFRAWDGDQLVGCVRVLSDGYFFNCVTEIMVDPAYQRRGIGRELMRRALNGAPRRKLFLGAQPGNEGFFERCGFTRGPVGFVGSGD